MNSNLQQKIKYINEINLDDLNKLIKIMELLRDPENGCAWDLKQTFSSISPFTIEEAYEVAQAIQDENFDELKEELGDLLLQVVFHSQLANEKKYFDFNDVVTAINKKLIRRHPHIFEKTLKIKTAEEVKKQWDKIKVQEKRAKQNNIIDNQVNEITKNLPSVIKAQKLQETASKQGFDFKNLNQCIQKLLEELDEFSEAQISNNNERLLDEGGDLIFSVINILRKLGINSEEALNHANRKFIMRYNKSEELAKKDSINFSNASLKIKNNYWLKSKKFFNKTMTFSKE